MGLFDKFVKKPEEEVKLPEKTEYYVAEVDEKETKEEKEVAYKERVEFAKYQRKYLNDKNKKANKALFVILIISIGVIGLALLSQIAYNVYSINQYAGYVVAVLLLVFYLIVYISFISFITSRASFHNIYDERNDKRKESIRHNNKVRTELAVHLVNMYEHTGVLKDNKVEYEPAVKDIINDIYGDVDKDHRLIKIDNTDETTLKEAQEYLADKKELKLKPERLKLALNTEICFNNMKYELYYHNRINQGELAESLKYLMIKNGPIYREAQRMIRVKAVECGISSAISQSKSLDGTIVALMNMQLITDLVYLYGYRPNDVQMNKIMFAIIRNVALAVGLNDLNVGGSIINRLMPKSTSNPMVSFFANLVDSTIQLAVNGTLTIIVGEQTVDYLLEEYEMQEVLRLTEADKEDYYIDVVGLKKNIQSDIMKKKASMASEAVIKN